MAKLRLRAALTFAAGILLTIGGCTEQSPTVNTRDASATQYALIELDQSGQGGAYDRLGAPRVTKVIGPEGGTISIPGGHSLAFPAGALKRPTNISVMVDPRYLGVDLGPEGIQFPVGKGPVLTINYDGIDVARFRSTSIAYVSPTGTVLEVLSTNIDKSRKTMSARLSHFSGYLVVAT